MVGYSPLKITGMTTGLVQERENFLLPDDAYPVLQNAYVWRERILRKKGFQLLGRVQLNIGTTDGSGDINVTIDPQPIQSGISSFVIGDALFNDPGGASPVNLLTTGPGTGTLNRATGQLIITGSNISTAVQYFPGLPIMGLRTRELQNSANDQLVVFDQNYSYNFNTVTQQFQRFPVGDTTTWNAHGGNVTATDFFWSTNYWVSQKTIPGTADPFFTTTNQKLFWETNNTGKFGATADPPRITDGITWYPFYDDSTPGNTPWAQIDATDYLTNFLSLLPFRGRMVTFNTWEGINATSSQNYSNRIRWSTIGNPFIPYDNGPPATGSWRDDIRGQGGFLDIPTSEDIVSVGFVRDNLVIYCERSTWQLRYTGRSISPFQIERVNSELGAEGPFSAVQFDTSLVGIGDKGVVECDSYQSQRIDVKIPDIVFSFQNNNNGPFRVHGIRNFISRLAYWTFPAANDNSIFPTQRLVYNYENDSWAIFNDSLTTLGNYQPNNSRNWLNTPKPWIECNFSWIDSTPAQIPLIVGGNQQGFVEILDQYTVNDCSLFISNITSNGVTATVVTSPNHNMKTGFVIGISGIPTGASYDNLNDGIFGIIVINANSFRLMEFDAKTNEFSIPHTDPVDVYEGGGLINIRENFSITSKKFNFLDQGSSIQLGYIDVLLQATEKNQPGAISLNVYLDYNDVEPSNTYPKNQINNYAPLNDPDTFFNSIIPTTSSNLNKVGGTKFWQRVFCSTRANFITIQYTFSNAQMAGEEQELGVQIDAQILWLRQAGRITQI